ncbi:AAA family ATPase [Streptomyces sp. NBC_01381]|uniref:AfsR/SARP family transcriptional regulator n=1 Tax=Streptomyces sp. NBC_01381 TaxID=2903845 RepID=UPI00224E0840|nr:BTAD domain-containing putative transcriptional regulator [Streptomyces sp. NBC_01381]MCX4665696.1 AAA family ATPase [Streptomyces sp. NBC_01381]
MTVAGGSGTVPLGPAKRLSLLAALLLRAGTPVSVDALTDALWDDEPPMHARTVIQGHVSRLRALLVEAGLDAYGVELATQGGAYALQFPETLLDVSRFEDLVKLAGQQRDPADAALMLQEALALWNGPALTGTVPTGPMLAAARGLEESRLVTVEQLAEAYGRLGAHGQAVALLRTESVQHPFREALVAALMRALQRCGRQSEALECFHRTRERLAEEMGVDPGKTLRRAYAEILDGEPDTGSHPTLAAAMRASGRGASPKKSSPSHPPVRPAAPREQEQPAAGAGATSAGAAPAPDPAPAVGRRSAGRVGPPLLERSRELGEGWAQRSPQGAGEQRAQNLLPRAPRSFVSREEQLAVLEAAVESSPEGSIALITGPAGVGKTALALHWAHRAAERHPQGTLFADLRGFSGGEAAQPSCVLREFLLALGVQPQDVPGGIEAAAALYRSLVAERHLLVVLDNARDSAQVRPLLPGTPHVTTVVTSRNRLDGLIASDLARPVPLGVLGERDAAELFVRALGRTGGADATAVRQVARLCDGLPLALRIAAARLSGRPQWSVADLAAELADGQRRLALLSAEDTGVAAALRTSVDRLPDGDAWLLASLARAFTRDVDAYAAAAVAGTDVPGAHEGLDRLAAAHLIQEESPGRYVLHDLVRLYARSLDGPADADLRLVDHWLRSLDAAVHAIDTTGYRDCALPAGCLPGPVRAFADRDTARGWFAAEQDGLLAASAAAAGLGDDDRAWRLAVLIWPTVLWRPHLGWRAPLERALEAAGRAGSDEGVGRLHSTLGVLLVETGHHEAALGHLERSLDPLHRAGLPEIAAQVLVLIGIARIHLDDPEGALRAQEEAVRTARESGHSTAALLEHHHAAQLALAGGDQAAAAGHAARAIASVPPDETAGWRPLIWESYGIALHRAGLHHEARAALLTALTVTEEEDLPARTAGALTQLGEVASVLDGPEGGADYRRRAEELRRSIPDSSM